MKVGRGDTLSLAILVSHVIPLQDLGYGATFVIFTDIHNSIFSATCELECLIQCY